MVQNDRSLSQIDTSQAILPGRVDQLTNQAIFGRQGARYDLTDIALALEDALLELLAAWIESNRPQKHLRRLEDLVHSAPSQPRYDRLNKTEARLMNEQLLNAPSFPSF